MINCFQFCFNSAFKFNLRHYNQGSVDYTLKISMVEIYNEEFKDLLANTGGALERLHTGGARVQLMEDANKGRAGEPTPRSEQGPVN